jgi:hypothetical protein
METIQVVLDRKLLQAADRDKAAALVLESQSREGYSRTPRVADKWEAEAAWPER